MHRTRRGFASITAAVLTAVLALQPVIALAQPSPARTAAPRPSSGRLSDRLARAGKAAPGHVVVKLEQVSVPAMRGLYSRHGLGAEDVSFGDGSVMRVKVPKGKKRDAFLRALKDDPAVEYAEPASFATLLDYTPPNDPAYNDGATWFDASDVPYPNAKSWWLRDKGVNAAAAWQHGYSAADFPVRAAAGSFKVGVIDNGFYMSHPDKGANIVAGWDFIQQYSSDTETFVEDGDVSPASEPDRYSRSHGTSVAGQVAAATNNGTGVASVGYDTQVRVYKVAGPWVEGYDDPDDYYDVPPGSVVIFNEVIARAIRRAADDGCKVINVSLGSYTDTQDLRDAVTYAQGKGSVVAAATGNDAELFEEIGHPVQLAYPARYPGVVGVGAYELDPSGQRRRSAFSNHGEGIDVLAPGEMVWGLGDPSQDFGYGATGYTWWSGTSMATPAFAGALAHLWRYQPSMSATEIRDYVLQRSVDTSATGYDVSSGWGFLDMGRVMSGFTTDYAYLAKPTLDLPATSASRSVALSWTAVAGRGVTYDVAVDGVSVGTTASTARTLSLEPGTHTVSVTTMSPYQWWDSRSRATAGISVDYVAPSGTFELAGGAAYATTRTVSIGSTVTNADEMRMSTDGGSTWTLWRAYAPDVSFTLPAGDGSKRVDVQYRTTASGETVTYSDTIQLDTVAPSGTFTLRGGLPSTRSSTVAAASSVTGATQWRVDVGAGFGAWTAYAAATNVTLPGGTGVKPVTAQYRDAAGNTTSLSDAITVLPAVATSRVWGSDRYDTAVAVSRRLYPVPAAQGGGARAVVVATGQNFPDALCAAPLATAYDGPLLLTKGAELTPATKAELERLRPATVFITGGTGVVTDGVKAALAGLSWRPSVIRLGGATRHDTASAVAAQIAKKRGTVPRVVVANGYVYADALLAAPMAAAKGWPILLVKPNAVTAGTTAKIGALKASNGLTSATVVGTTTNVYPAVSSALGVSAERVGGTSRDAYDLSMYVADYALKQGGTSAHIALATGLGYADALSSGPMIAAGAGPSGKGPSFGVLLFSAYDARYPNRLAAPVATWLAAHRSDPDVSEVTAVGGAGVVTDANFAAAVAALD